MLSDDWFLRYGLKQNLKVNGNGNGNANVNANADAKVSTIALPVLCTGELIKIIISKIRKNCPLKSSYVASRETGLCLTWLETPKIGFLLSTHFIPLFYRIASMVNHQQH